MINLLLGAPGGGKSYEAVVYHVLPAVKRGRLVITNLPLLIESFEAVEPGSSKFIELREKTLAVLPVAIDPSVEKLDARGGWGRKFSTRAFANPEDYLSTWRMADGTGPLYVVDECHFALPRIGTVSGVEEWFSVHRHFNVDVLLITQSSGKISAAIKDLVQVVYKVRKAVAFGRPRRYIRKVLDGVNGAEIAVTERTYLKQMFMLYRSHTLGVEIDEQGAADVAPFIVKFKRATWVVFGLAAVGVVWWVLSYKNHPVVRSATVSSVESAAMAAGAASGLPRPVASASGRPVQATDPAIVAAALLAAEVAKKDALDPEPFLNKSFHLSGMLQLGKRVIYHFMVSENGLPVATVTDEDLMRAGYTWRPFFACAGILTWQGKKAYPVTCDSPQISMAGNEGHAVPVVKDETVVQRPVVTRVDVAAASEASKRSPAHLVPPKPVPVLH